MKATVEIIKKEGIPVGQEYDAKYYNDIGIYQVNDMIVFAYLFSGVMTTLFLSKSEILPLFNFEKEKPEVVEEISSGSKMDGEIFLKALSIVVNKEKYKDIDG